jgi:hypothetical protein
MNEEETIKFLRGTIVWRERKVMAIKLLVVWLLGFGMLVTIAYVVKHLS